MPISKSAEVSWNTSQGRGTGSPARGGSRNSPSRGRSSTPRPRALLGSSSPTRAEPLRPRRNRHADHPAEPAIQDVSPIAASPGSFNLFPDLHLGLEEMGCPTGQLPSDFVGHGPEYLPVLGVVGLDDLERPLPGDDAAPDQDLVDFIREIVVPSLPERGNSLRQRLTT